MTSSDIQKALDHHFLNAWMKLKNSCVLGWEADYLCWVDKTYWCEVEIKISRADFKRDFTHKPEKHRAIQNAMVTGKGFVRSGRVYDHYNQRPYNSTQKTVVAKATELFRQVTPNRFYFACPDGLIKPEELPKGYGLIYVLENGKTLLAKRPGTIHKEPLAIMKDVAIKQHFVNEELKKKIEHLEHRLSKIEKRHEQE